MSIIPSKDNLYNNDKGILEVGILESKRVLIIGLGSFGSQIAIELAKAGVGHFSLIDFDRVEPHNLSRHTCTVNELGRLKTDALYDAIKGKSPYATIDKYPVNINNNLKLLYDEVKKADIVICATDNNRSRFNITTALLENKTVGIYGRAVTRAEGGDVFRYRPGGPCYCCLVGSKAYKTLGKEEITNEGSARKEGRIAPYTLPEDADAMVQIGLSADIQPMCNMMVKLALIELSKGQESGISCLEEELVWDCYLWANRRERYRKNWSPMANNPNGGATIMRWYGLKLEKNCHCPICGEDDITLDTGD